MIAIINEINFKIKKKVKTTALRRRKKIQFKWVITQSQSINVCEKYQGVIKYQNLIMNLKSKSIAKPMKLL